QKQKKLIMLPSETMIWQPEFTDKTLSRKPGAVHNGKHLILYPPHQNLCQDNSELLGHSFYHQMNVSYTLPRI
ncbi:hypothetical protein ACMWJ8_24025, partial [Escherichia coli]|uniref:hypothetical protein n=1 Tax=Escherichia coli TaxID=562 RepID=UPI0039E1E2BE